MYEDLNRYLGDVFKFLFDSIQLPTPGSLKDSSGFLFYMDKHKMKKYKYKKK